MHPTTSFSLEFLKSLRPCQLKALADTFGLPQITGRTKRLARILDALPRAESEYDVPPVSTPEHRAFDRLFVCEMIDRMFPNTETLRALIMRVTGSGPGAVLRRSRAELLATLKNNLIPPGDLAA